MIENNLILDSAGKSSLLHESTGQNQYDDRSDAQEESFSYEGYQVVRREFFSHIHEPSIVFNRCKISLNTACLKKLPDVDYVQILVNPEEKKLAVRPQREDKKDTFLWCTTSNEQRKPRQITCRMFFAKVIQMMDWNPDCRYKILGKLIRSSDEYLFIFDLTATEVYQCTLSNDDKPRMSRTPVYPAEWQNQFGLPVEEHSKLLQVNIFDGYTVFGIKENNDPQTELARKAPSSGEGLKV
ncbi:integrase [Caproiciproducens sp.]|uniref:integrase n=1 Tax=Caproiciproducens sp. TaxID=1954376 RepID=UPI00289AD694|nr:integrase [Caproiciproducens sp.]